MLNHVVLDSSLDFVIIGPIGTKDGILIRSESVDIKLVGIAHRLYRKKRVEARYLYGNLIKSVWSSSFPFGHREFNFLIVFQNSELLNRTASNSPKRNRFMNSDEKAIQIEFNRFIENSSRDLSELIAPADFSNAPLSVVNTGHLLWNVAPLILACSNEHDY